MIYPGCLALILVFFLLLLLPFFFAEFTLTALAKLGLSPPVAFIVLVGIITGSIVNKRPDPKTTDLSITLMLLGEGGQRKMPKK